MVPGRQLDDDGTVLLRFANGAKGVLMASQVALGEENNLTIKIYGDKASVEWSQMEPNSLWLKFANAPAQLLRTGVGNLSAAARNNAFWQGHEGYLEAFANIYVNFANLIRAQQHSSEVQPEDFDVPGIGGNSWYGIY